MSTASVRQAITRATSNDPPSCAAGSHLDAGEAKAVVRAAQYGAKGRKSPITKGELAAISDLFDRRLSREPGQIYTLACPESARSVTMDDAAVTTLRDFLLGQGVATPKMVSPAFVYKMRATYQDISLRGLLQWKPVREGLPVGVRYLRVELMRERHPDGYTYTALVPVGAMRPGVPLADPNRASSFFVERSGGIAGWTQIAGPFELKAPRK